MPARATPHRAPGHRPRAPDRRPSAARRGYDHHWQRVRLVHLALHPLCVDCREQGRLTPAAQVHHVAKVSDRPDLLCDPDNLMSLCERCHSRRTARGE